MTGKIKYQFETKMWRHNTTGGWYFVSLPKDISKEIRKTLQWQEEGWGRMKAIAKINNVQWDTAIWFDTKMDAYILPIKSEIRKRTKLEIDQEFDMAVWV
ncbi:DUF1905 domain-containing protein [Flagellimonas meridianipacifica]|uniref:Uncharacterized protein DUF1905 n=1 Tax=Flagellimonas meridianipacifica TaxID=1080225 RepID=A0A2T0MBA6_9FLAO|nr:DUF1905 domain-containing protein [Allomuricauda pacifica]PRX54779.1 uncharacterized protein DUF1905 [Allomuricauda pacifica]